LSPAAQFDCAPGFGRASVCHGHILRHSNNWIGNTHYSVSYKRILLNSACQAGEHQTCLPLQLLKSIHGIRVCASPMLLPDMATQLLCNPGIAKAKKTAGRGLISAVGLVTGQIFAPLSPETLKANIEKFSLRSGDHEQQVCTQRNHSTASICQSVQVYAILTTAQTVSVLFQKVHCMIEPWNTTASYSC
jgi:hypothetical protein